MCTPIDISYIIIWCVNNTYVLQKQAHMDAHKMAHHNDFMHPIAEHMPRNHWRARPWKWNVISIQARLVQFPIFVILRLVRRRRAVFDVRWLIIANAKACVQPSCVSPSTSQLRSFSPTVWWDGTLRWWISKNMRRQYAVLLRIVLEGAYRSAGTKKSVIAVERAPLFTTWFRRNSSIFQKVLSLQTNNFFGDETADISERPSLNTHLVAGRTPKGFFILFSGFSGFQITEKSIHVTKLILLQFACLIHAEGFHRFIGRHDLQEPWKSLIRCRLRLRLRLRLNFI
jgi:hypothetical protein